MNVCPSDCLLHTFQFRVHRFKGSTRTASCQRFCPRFKHHHDTDTMKRSRYLDFYVVAVREALARWDGNDTLNTDAEALAGHHFTEAVLVRLDDPSQRALMIQRQAECTRLPSWFGNALELTLYQVCILVHFHNNGCRSPV